MDHVPLYRDPYRAVSLVAHLRPHLAKSRIKDDGTSLKHISRLLDLLIPRDISQAVHKQAYDSAVEGVKDDKVPRSGPVELPDI